MIKHLLFLKWWLVMSIVAVSGYFLTKFGICQEIWETDSTFICVGIVGVFAIMSVWCGMKTYVFSHAVQKNNENLLEQIKNQEQIGWFVADCFTMAGFIGTIWGMIVALNGFDGINPSDILSIQKLISSLVKGVSIALYTTLTGLVCGMLLKVQYYNLGYELLKKGNNNEQK